MMKRCIVLIAFLLLGTRLSGQYRIDDGSELLTLQQVPMEKMYVHLSSAVLFSGEYLYYKLYNLNALTGRLSKASTLAYVRLVDADGRAVFEHKVPLSGGLGQGDYFVNTDIASGTYTLLGYTNWMKNGGLQQLFQQDISILNPYRIEQSGPGEAAMDSAQTTRARRITYPPLETTEGGLLELGIDTNLLKQRQGIALNVRNYKGALGHGTYSLVVRKKNELPDPGAASATQFSTAYADAAKRLPQGVGDSIYLPEQRGELIFGRVVRASDGAPAEGVEVVVSIPGKGFILKSATTDPDGYFFTYLRKPYTQENILFQIPEPGDYSIQRGVYRELDMASLPGKSYFPGPGAREGIVKRSIHNQLENAYFQIKPDSVLAEDPPDPFDGGIPDVFVLDDYTRFPTLEETLVEILNFVGYRNNPDGPDYIRVGQDFETYDEAYNSDPAIVLVDGLFIWDHSRIRDLNARTIETIRVLRDPLVLGPNRFQGIVSFETFEGDFWETYRAPNALRSELQLPTARKRYFRQVHQGETAEIYDRVPDFRSVLLWEPDLEITGTGRRLQFYTSDLSGTFEIVLEGFTTYGKPITLRKEFRVVSPVE